MHVGCYRNSDHHLFFIFSERPTKGVLFPIGKHKAWRTSSTVSTFSTLQPYYVITSDTYGQQQQQQQGVFALLNAQKFLEWFITPVWLTYWACHKMNVNLNSVRLLSCVLEFIIVLIDHFRRKKKFGVSLMSLSL